MKNLFLKSAFNKGRNVVFMDEDSAFDFKKRASRRALRDPTFGDEVVAYTWGGHVYIEEIKIGERVQG